MSDTQVEQSDVEEITHMVEVIHERADTIRAKAFTLRQVQKPDDASEKEVQTGDFASDIKRRLDRIQGILIETAESLGRFAG